MTAASDRGGRPPAKRVARNTVLRGAAEIVGKLASLILLAYIARALGAETLGHYIFALSVGQLVWAVAGFGLDQMALREIARHRTIAVERLFFDSISFKLLIGAAAVVVAAGAVAALEYPGEVIALVAILGLAALLTLLTETAQTVFQAYERMEYYLLAYLPNKVLGSLFGISVLLAGAGIMAVAIGAVVAAVVGLGVAVFLVYRFFARPRPRLRAGAVALLARAAAPFGLQEISGVVLYRADIVLLSLLTTSVVVGTYGAAYRLIEATFFLAWSIGQSVLPMFSYLDRDSDPTLDRVLAGALKFVTVVLTPVAVTLLVCAEPVIDLIFGLPAYADSVPVLRWLAFVTLVYALANLASTFVLVHLPGRVTIAVFLSAAGLNVALNLALIPPLGAIGAAVATLASELCLLATVLVLAIRVVKTPHWPSVVGGAAVAGAAMAAAMLPMSAQLWLALPVGAVVYLGVLAVFEARHAGGDIQVVREILRSRPTPEGTLRGT